MHLRITSTPTRIYASRYKMCSHAQSPTNYLLTCIYAHNIRASKHMDSLNPWSEVHSPWSFHSRAPSDTGIHGCWMRRSLLTSGYRSQPRMCQKVSSGPKVSMTFAHYTTDHSTDLCPRRESVCDSLLPLLGQTHRSGSEDFDVKNSKVTRKTTGPRQRGKVLRQSDRVKVALSGKIRKQLRCVTKTAATYERNLELKLVLVLSA
ncbi:hypothetical protein K435DRAFT_206680 [Dendrothele bispora CBS 962.96]|uniref:Uncharacterized protein n=1 Tax=Dendrothele bispora (strain CBS 962.96) TaxID=1314807 RepID=A0A4S8LT19_DENBC|nr:hypothetical protein K435DRAFT_206680 [Dendrothele bispora CBS 962.96]